MEYRKVNVTPALYAKLEAEAKREDRSVTKTLDRLLTGIPACTCIKLPGHHADTTTHSICRYCAIVDHYLNATSLERVKDRWRKVVKA